MNRLAAVFCACIYVNGNEQEKWFNVEHNHLEIVVEIRCDEIRRGGEAKKQQNPKCKRWSDTDMLQTCSNFNDFYAFKIFVLFFWIFYALLLLIDYERTNNEANKFMRLLNGFFLFNRLNMQRVPKKCDSFSLEDVEWFGIECFMSSRKTISNSKTYKSFNKKYLIIKCIRCDDRWPCTNHTTVSALKLANEDTHKKRSWTEFGIGKCHSFK